MAKLMGHVDRADQFLVAGWALVDDDPSRYPEVKIVQQGRVVVTLRPTFSAPNVRRALGLTPTPASVPPNYVWRLWFPLSNGLRPEIPFSILFSESNAPLALGVDRKIDLYRNMDEEAVADLKNETLFFPSFERAGERIKIWFKVAGPSGNGPVPKLSARLNQTQVVNLTLTRDPFVFEKPVYFGMFECDIKQLFSETQGWASVGTASDSDATTRTEYHNSLRTLYVPKSISDATRRVASIPDAANIGRVSGLASNGDQYLAGGLTTFLQLNSITRRYFQRPITDFPVVVDWGAGCARVMRNFFEAPVESDLRRNPDQDILGVDIDEKNIDWCLTNMKGQGRYELLELDGFRIDSHSVDLVYGISVMTHLSEYHQHLWLAEIARILKPGGCAVLTTHGEFFVYGEYAMTDTVGIMTPFVDKFGFFDGIPDSAIGAEFETYYRATYHSRKYIRSNWSRYFEILDIVPAANAFRQDFVVLRSHPRAKN